MQRSLGQHTAEARRHWRLDISFGEGGRRIRKRHTGENVALLCRLALGLLKQHPILGSIKCKRLQVAMDVREGLASVCGFPFSVRIVQARLFDPIRSQPDDGQ